MTRFRSLWRGFFFVYLVSVTCQATLAQQSDGQSLLKNLEPNKQTVAGKWEMQREELVVQAAEGARLMLPVPSNSGEYDLKVSFTRKTGVHSVGLIVVQNGKQVAFEVDAWGMNLAGFQNLSGKDIRQNPSRRERVKLENNRRYTMTVQVRKDHLRGLLDDQEIARVETNGQNISIPDVWRLPSNKVCGLIAWESQTVFHSVDFRVVTADKPVPPSTATTSGKQAPATAGKTTSAPTKAMPKEKAKPENRQAKRVLLVIANHHFFYREYADPREELERAGFKVTVAAGRKAPCDAHENSGQGADRGIVTPDVALSEVKAKDYDAILFSGGWGASMYQFAFNGRYNDASYNGNPEIKREANRLIGEFLAEDKYVCALCNATSVLAWARVNGKSPLQGKSVCAPPREAPPGIYNGRPGQPSCRWHAEMNGAKMSPAGAVGRPGTAVDDVMVDGRIITGEDDISAREMGRRIVEVLSK